MAELKKGDPIPKGLSALAIPELGEGDNWGKIKPTTEEESLSRLNSFLKVLNEQGVDIVSVFDVDVDAGSRPGVVGNIVKKKKFAIVRKI